MKKLLVYMKGYRKECVIAPLFKMAEALMELFIPLAVASIIDKGIGLHNTDHIIKMCIIMITLGFLGLLFSVTAQYFSAKAAIGFTAKLRHALFSHIQELSYSELDDIGSSTLITRLTSDMNQVQNGVNLTLRLFLRSPFIVIGAAVMAFTIDVHAAWIFVGTVLLLSAVVFGIMLGCIPLYNKIQKKLDDVLDVTQENLSGIRVIRAFCKEEEEINEFQNSNNELTNLQKYTGKISALMNPITYIIINLAVIILVYTGALEVYKGVITQGAVVALYNYMSQILVELVKLANLIITVTKAAASGNRIEEALELSNKMMFGSCKVEGNSNDYIIEVNNADLRYENASACSLTDINLKVKRGQTIGIIGGTGSGKTSLINIISRFYDVESGEVLLNGKNIKEYDRKELRSVFGIVPQKAVLFKGSIRDNIKWGKKDASDDEIMYALEIAQAKEIVENKPDGLDFEIEQGGRNLSGGQRQRLTIARAIVGCPEILILDDSSSALDYATDAKLRKAIRNMKGDPTVFIVSQRASSILYADQIIVLDDGISVGKGTHDELMNSCEVYREIYNSQFEKAGENK